MRIVALEAENIKRLVAVAITPIDPVVIVGGKNAAGKSSVLDSIAYALGGKSLVCDKPLRTGQKEGHVSVTLDGDAEKSIPPLIVTRTFRASGTTSLKVSTPDGMKPATPQKLLDSLCGQVAFDPLSFTRLKPTDQAATLRSLVGLDFSTLDRQRASVFEQRTLVNRDEKAAKARLEAAAQYPDASTEEVSVAALVAELEKAQATNRQQSEVERKAKQCIHDMAEVVQKVKREMAEIAIAERHIAELDERRKTLQAEAANLTANAKAMPRIECEALHATIVDSERINKQVRANRAYTQLQEQHSGLAAKAKALTDTIAEIDADKQAQLETAKWPVDGLSFGEDGIAFQGLPFEQASSAEQLRVAAAIGLALNPTLRVLLIRDGSLLDGDNLRMLSEMAAEADAQIWLERVGDGAECAVVIEDGTIQSKGETDA